MTSAYLRSRQTFLRDACAKRARKTRRLARKEAWENYGRLLGMPVTNSSFERFHPPPNAL